MKVELSKEEGIRLLGALKWCTLPDKTFLWEFTKRLEKQINEES